MERESVKVFMNGDIEQNRDVTFYPHQSKKDLLHNIMETFQIAHTQRCKVFDSNGGEVSDEDIDIIDTAEPLFLSMGEDFQRNSVLALYEEQRILGKGGFGIVKLWNHKINGNQVAIKFVDLDIPTDKITQLYSELQALRELNHPSIVKLLDNFNAKGKMCFVMEYCSGGELKHHLYEKGPLPEDECYSIILQIVEAVRQCHNSNIIHRDLKLENILFSDATHSRIKIVDFGIAGMFVRAGLGSKGNAGSLRYMAPEILNESGTSSTPALDIWSIGVIIYALLTKRMPFRGATREEVIENIQNIQYKPMSHYRHISKPWVKLVSGILREDPTFRWSLRRINQHLRKYRYETEYSDTSSDEEAKQRMTKEKPSPSKSTAVFNFMKGTAASMRRGRRQTK